MIEAEPLSDRWAVQFTNGVHRGYADTSKNGVGGAAGMRPHELLEAALASCLAISARLVLEGEGVQDVPVHSGVEVEREPQFTRFRCTVGVDTDDEQRRELVRNRLAASPVRTTLSKPLQFELNVD